MRTCVVSAANGHFAPISQIAWPTHAAYAAYHGYDCQATTLQPEDIPPSWRKVSLCKGLLLAGYQALWLDADMAVVERRFSLQTHWPKDSSVLLASQNLGGHILPSCGLMAVRGEVGRRWLDELWRRFDAFRDHPWWEQAAAFELLGYDHSDPQLAVSRPRDRHNGPTEWTEHVTLLDPKHHATMLEDHKEAFVFHATGTTRGLPERRAALEARCTPR